MSRLRGLDPPGRLQCFRNVDDEKDGKEEQGEPGVDSEPGIVPHEDSSNDGSANFGKGIEGAGPQEVDRPGDC